MATPSQKYSVEERRQLWEDGGRMCFYCDKSLPKPGTKAGKACHFDHLVPVSKGGSDCLSNLRASCKRCNTEKSNTEYEAFLKKQHAVTLKKLNRLATLLYELNHDPFWDTVEEFEDFPGT